MSTIEVNKITPVDGTTATTLGDSGDTFTVPTGAGLTVTDEVKTNKISPASGTTFTLGDSGDTFNIPSGATIANAGTATGFGESNTPAFAAVYSSAGSGLANGTYVKLSFDSELYDSGSVYDTSNYRFTPGVAGKYFIHARTLISAASTSPNQGRIAIYKNGSLFNFWRWTNTASISDFSMQISAFDTANTTDYYEAYIYQNNTGSSTSFSINSDPSQTSLFMGYRITT